MTLAIMWLKRVLELLSFWFSPKTKSQPSGAVGIWRGGAAE